MRIKMLAVGTLLALGVAAVWAGTAGGQVVGRAGTGGTGGAVGPIVSTAAASVGGPLVGGPVRPGGAAGGGTATQAATSDAQKAIEKYLKDKGGPGLTGRVEEVANAELKALFAGYTFVLVTIPQWPVARLPQPPLAMNNVFAVDAKGAVTHITKADELEKFFKDKLPALKGEDQLKAATAWATLTCEFYQDGMFKFIVGKPTQLPSRGAAAMVQIETTVDPAGGNTGSIISSVSVSPSGALMSATDQSTLKAGMRPICQSTKLLDPDPLVRRMAEQDLLVMGRACLWYLDMMRPAASPELQSAIDSIKERIERNDRIAPQSQ